MYSIVTLPCLCLLLSVLRGIDRVEELLDNVLEFRVIVLPWPRDRRVRCSMSIATKSTFLSATVKMQTSENNVCGFCCTNEELPGPCVPNPPSVANSG